MYVLAHLPYIPFIHSVQDILLLFFIMARVTGLFIGAPLWSMDSIPVRVKVGLIAFITVLLLMILYPDYLGPSPIYHLPELNMKSPHILLMVGILSVKEFAVGFLIGFVFKLLMEAVVIGGQSASRLMGFAIAQMFDPATNQQRPILSTLFSMVLLLIFLATDGHLLLLRLLKESFSIVPLGHYQLSPELLQDITKGSARMYPYSLKFIAIPYVILFLVTFILGFMAKVMPEMNVFMVGMPLKVLVGFYTVYLGIAYFPLVYNEGIVEFYNLAQRILWDMSPFPKTLAPA